jgi:hypothetical protein
MSRRRATHRGHGRGAVPLLPAELQDEAGLAGPAEGGGEPADRIEDEDRQKAAGSAAPQHRSLTSECLDETEHSRREPEQQHWTSEGTERRRGGEAGSGRSGGRGGRCGEIRPAAALDHHTPWWIVRYVDLLCVVVLQVFAVVD